MTREGRLMLILNRRVGQTILIGADVVITVEEIDRRQGRVRLSVRAPRSVPVDRAEVRAKKLAARAAGGKTCRQ
jgi:carbon storage regulator